MKFTGPGAILLPLIHTPGTGYTPGELYSIDDGELGQIQIVAVLAGVPIAILLTNAGRLYIPALNVPTSGGPGTGLTVDITARPLFGFAPPAGSGSIQQKWRNVAVIRRRTIQKQHSDSGRYLGSNLIASPQASLRTYNNLKLRSLAQFWDSGLSGADRGQWDIVAPGGFNGFDYFMQLNLTGYALYNSTLPVIGQNLGDTVGRSAWDFTPCLPKFLAGMHSPGKNNLTLVFTGGTRFSLGNLTGSGDTTSFAEHVTIYSTRPWSSSYKANQNPLVRLGRFFVTASGSVFWPTDPMDTATGPLKTLWERVIGGALSGEKITYGWRYVSVRPPVGITGPLHTSTVTVL